MILVSTYCHLIDWFPSIMFIKLMSGSFTLFRLYNHKLFYFIVLWITFSTISIGIILFYHVPRSTYFIECNDI